MRGSGCRCVWLALLGIAGCMEEKGLPEKPVARETTPEVNPLKPPRPERDDPAARKIVEDALAVHTAGEPGRLKKFHSHRMLLRGQITAANEPLSHVREAWAAWPNRFAFRFDVQNRTTFAGVVTASEGLRRVDASTVSPMPAILHQACLIDCAALDWGATLVALANPEAIFHRPLEVASQGKRYRTVKCWTPDLPEWTLWFNTETKRLEQIHYEGLEESLIKTKSLYFSGEFEHEGVKLPREISLSISGNRMFDWVLESLETPEMLDEKLFEQPPAARQ